MAPELNACRGIAPLELADTDLGRPIRAKLNLSTW